MLQGHHQRDSSDHVWAGDEGTGQVELGRGDKRNWRNWLSFGSEIGNSLKNLTV